MSNTTNITVAFAPSLSALSPFSSRVAAVKTSTRITSTLVAARSQRITMSASVSPSSSSSTSPAKTTSPAVGTKDLLVFGAGVLGGKVAGLWTHQPGFEGAKVFTLTKSDQRHDALRTKGFCPMTTEQIFSNAANMGKFPYVIFCAPPSGSGDYVQEVRNALKLWNSGDAKASAFVFTSSTGSFKPSEDGDREVRYIDETSPIRNEDDPRGGKFIQAENAVRNAGGCAIRFAGLYTRNRGPHTYWLQQKKCASKDEIINMIHYDDAAYLAVLALQQPEKSRGNLFLGTAMHNSREEINEAYRVIHKQNTVIEYDPSIDRQNRNQIFQNEYTRKTLQWEPRYRNYLEGLEKEEFD